MEGQEEHCMDGLQMHLQTDWTVSSMGWDAVRMTAAAAAQASPSPSSKSSPRACKGGGALRSANTSCQVDGCTQQLLPMRSYYQRQHICEEHFRALVITDASGQVSRFCQQCTKLEPLESFDGERRSCRASLERRNQRRHGKRGGGTAAKARRTTKGKSPGVVSAARKPAGKGAGSLAAAVAAAASGATHSHSGPGHSGSGVSGSGSGSTAAVADHLSSPSLQATQSFGGPEGGPGLQLPLGLFPLPGATAPANGNLPAHAGTGGGWVPELSARAQPGSAAAFLLAAAPLQQQQHHHVQYQQQQYQQYPAHLAAAWPGGYAPPPLPPLPSPSAGTDMAAPRGAAAASLASIRVLALGEVPLRCGGGASSGASAGASSLSSALDVDDLLAMDTDKLRVAILESGVLQGPSGPAMQGANSGGSTVLSASPPPAGAVGGWTQQLPPGGGMAGSFNSSSVAAVLGRQPGEDDWLQPFADEAEPAPPAGAPSLSPFGNGLPSMASLPPQQPQQWAQQPRWPQPALAGRFGAFGGAAAHAAPAGAQHALAAHLSHYESDVQAMLAELGAPAYEEARVSIKIFGVRPDQLPRELRAQLLAALRLPSTHVQASLRSGCVHLTLDALVSAEERRSLTEPGAAAVVAARLAPLAAALPAPARLAVQVGGGSAALLAAQGAGEPALLLSLPGAGGAGGAAAVLPPALELAPGGALATTVSAAAGRFRLRCPRAVLSGAGQLSLHCRCGGRHLAVGLGLPGARLEPPPVDDAPSSEGDSSDEEGSHSEDAVAGSQAFESSDGDDETVVAEGGAGGSWVEAEAWVAAAAEAQAEAPGNGASWQPGWGLYEFELSRGALLGEALPVLVLPDVHADAAAELARLPAGRQGAGVLRLAAAVLRFLEQQEAAASSTAAAAAFTAAYSPVATARVAAAAGVLTGLCQRAGWHATARLLQPALAGDGAYMAHAAQQAQRAQQDAAYAATTVAPPQATALLASGSGSLGMATAPGKLGGSPQGSLSVGAAKLAGAKLAGDDVASPRLGLTLRVPELDERDCRRCVMHPAVLGVVTVVVAGLVLGVGAAMVSGHLG